MNTHKKILLRIKSIFTVININVFTNLCLTCWGQLFIFVGTTPHNWDMIWLRMHIRLLLVLFTTPHLPPSPRIYTHTFLNIVNRVPILKYNLNHASLLLKNPPKLSYIFQSKIKNLHNDQKVILGTLQPPPSLTLFQLSTLASLFFHWIHQVHILLTAHGTVMSLHRRLFLHICLWLHSSYLCFILMWLGRGSQKPTPPCTLYLPYCPSSLYF